MKKCTWCGKEYEDTATVCDIDAKPLEAVAPPPITQPWQSSPPDEAPVPSESLLFPRQIGRASFVVRYLLFMVAVAVGAFLAAAGVEMLSSVPGLTTIAVLLLSVVVLLVALFYFIRHGVVARLRDIGIHSLFALLIFVPIVNIVFLLILALTPRNGFKKR